MANLKDFAEQLVNLSVKDVNELATILKEDHGIEPAAAAVAVAGPAAGGGTDSGDEKTEFDVILKSAGAAKLQVVKNTLLKKAFETNDTDFSKLYDVLVGNTSIMQADEPNSAAKVIREFRKKNQKPILKAAYLEESLYIGDENLSALADLKSKNELIGDIITLLQSPAKNVIASLQSGGNKLSAIVKALQERTE